MKIEIEHRFTGSVLFSHEAEENSVKITLAEAIENGADLARADLARADLTSADLSGADLTSADLSGADLSGADLSGEILTQSPIQILTNIWPVLISDNYMKIGCQRHTHDEWANFTDDEIRAMDSGARLFWRDWKEPLLALCRMHNGKGKK